MGAWVDLYWWAVVITGISMTLWLLAWCVLWVMDKVEG